MAEKIDYELKDTPDVVQKKAEKVISNVLEGFTVGVEDESIFQLRLIYNSPNNRNKFPTH